VSLGPEVDFSFPAPKTPPPTSLVVFNNTTRHDGGHLVPPKDEPTLAVNTPVPRPPADANHDDGRENDHPDNTLNQEGPSE